MSPVGKTIAQEEEKRRRRLKLTRKKAAELLSKRKELDKIRKANRKKVVSDAADTQAAPLPEPLHPVAVQIVEAVAAGHLEEVSIYKPAEEVKTKEGVPKGGLPPLKTWWQSLHEYWDMIGKL